MALGVRLGDRGELERLGSTAWWGLGHKLEELAQESVRAANLPVILAAALRKTMRNERRHGRSIAPKSRSSLPRPRPKPSESQRERLEEIDALVLVELGALLERERAELPVLCFSVTTF